MGLGLEMSFRNWKVASVVWQDAPSCCHQYPLCHASTTLPPTPSSACWGSTPHWHVEIFHPRTPSSGPLMCAYCRWISALWPWHHLFLENAWAVTPPMSLILLTRYLKGMSLGARCRVISGSKYSFMKAQDSWVGEGKAQWDESHISCPHINVISYLLKLQVVDFAILFEAFYWK